MDADQALRPPAGAITIEREGADRRVLCLRGDVDTAVATRFTSAQGRERVVVDAIDAGGVTFISSSGLALMLLCAEASRAAGRHPVLRAASRRSTGRCSWRGSTASSHGRRRPRALTGEPRATCRAARSPRSGRWRRRRPAHGRPRDSRTRRSRVGAAPVKRQGAGDVEQAAGDDEDRGGDPGVGPQRGQGERVGRAEADEHPSDEPFGRPHPGQVRTRRHRGEGPQDDQAHQPVRAGNGEEEHRSGRPGDQQEDHHVVGPLQHAAGGRSPVPPVVEGAHAEQSAEATCVDRDTDAVRRPRGGDHEQGSRDERCLEPHQMQPAAQERLLVVDATPGVVEQCRRPGRSRVRLSNVPTSGPGRVG